MTKQADTETPYFAFCPQIDLGQHIQIKSPSDESQDERKIVEDLLPSVLDQPWTNLIPSWEIVVQPLSKMRCFIAFSYSHNVIDGISGIALHRTFLEAMQENQVEHDRIVNPPRRPLKEPFDSPERLPISWSYMLSPILGAYLPKSVASMLGFKASAAQSLPGTWTGAPVSISKEYLTMVQLMSIDNVTLTKVLAACRKNDSKLTGLLHQLILDALAAHLTLSIDSLGYGTAINMRGAIDVSDDTMGMFVSGNYVLHHLSSTTATYSSDQSFDWSTAREITQTLSSRSKDLLNQPIGLLRYLTSIRSWLLSKVGSRRESSYEISNLGVFMPVKEDGRGSGSVEVKEMVFCQPAGVYGPPLVFNVVSVKGGSLSVAVNWQPGALGIGDEEKKEKDLVKKICDDMRQALTRIADGDKK